MAGSLVLLLRLNFHINLDFHFIGGYALNLAAGGAGRNVNFRVHAGLCVLFLGFLLHLLLRLFLRFLHGRFHFLKSHFRVGVLLRIYVQDAAASQINNLHVTVGLIGAHAVALDVARGAHRLHGLRSLFAEYSHGFHHALQRATGNF